LNNQKKLVLDTNVIISNPEILNNKEYHIVLPFTVIRELDKLKQTIPDLKPSIQQAFKIILERYNNGGFSITDIPKDNVTNDEKIINVAQKENACIYTEDLGARIIAMARGVNLYTNGNLETKKWDKTYIGYREIKIDKGLYYSNFDVTNFHTEEIEIREVEEVLDEYLESDKPILMNESLVIIPDDDTDKYTVLLKNSDSHYKLLKTSLRLMKKAEVSRKGLEFLHPEQAIAFNLIFSHDYPLVIIEGEVGSGKTLISMMAAIARTFGDNSNKKYYKILVTRAPVPISKQMDLGFRPGTTEDKMNGWLAGFTSNLEFLFENNLEEAENHRAESIFNKYFQAIPIDQIQGASFNNKIVLVDEAQLLDKNTLAQILMRIGEGSKVVLMMDTKQTYGANRGIEGFKTILPHVKNNELIGYVKLQNVQRSKLVSMVKDIFQTGF
jgi:predicted ribonuclease YlaK